MDGGRSSGEREQQHHYQAHSETAGIRNAVKGRNEDVLQALDKMVANGELEESGEGRQRLYSVRDVP